MTNRGKPSPALQSADADPGKDLPGCHWRDVQGLTENVGVVLQTIQQRIELANSDTLAGIFGDVQWANREKLPGHALTRSTPS